MLLAKTGDKSRLAAAGMAGALPAVPVWTGARFTAGADHEPNRYTDDCAFMYVAGPGTTARRV